MAGNDCSSTLKVGYDRENFAKAGKLSPLDKAILRAAVFGSSRLKP